MQSIVLIRAVIVDAQVTLRRRWFCGIRQRLRQRRLEYELCCGSWELPRLKGEYEVNTRSRGTVRVPILGMMVMGNRWTVRLFKAK